MSQRAPTVPGPPLLGNTIQFLRDPVGFHDRYVREHGDVVRISVGGMDFHYVTHPETVERVLTDGERFRKASLLRRQAGGYLGDGLFFATGEQWRRQRTASSPAFYQRAVEEYATVALEHARDTVAAWTDGERVAVESVSRELALSVLTRALFGRDIRTEPETRRVVADAAEALNARLDATRLGTYLPDWIPSRVDRRFERARVRFDAFVDQLAAERRGREAQREDLLDVLLAAHEAGELDGRELRDGLMTFLFAGHETTSLAMTYTWYLLATHPEAQARLHRELAALDDLSPETLRESPYLGAVIRESMRLYPPAYMILRETSESVELDGYRVPGGETLILPQWVVHRDGRWWEHPSRFEPARWLDERDRPEFAYFPFGGGRRRCIGAGFATLELKTTLAAMARQVRFEDPPDDLSLSFAVTLRPDSDVTMTVRRR